MKLWVEGATLTGLTDDGVHRVTAPQPNRVPV